MHKVQLMHSHLKAKKKNLSIASDGITNRTMEWLNVTFNVSIFTSTV